MRTLFLGLLTLILPLQAQAACDWLAKPEADAHAIISSRLACLSDPYSLACVEFDEEPRKAREAERLRRISDLQLDEAEAAHLTDRALWLGASKDMACLAWGKPHRVEEAAGNPFGETWFYDEVDVLRFDGNALVGISTPDTSLGATDL